MAHQLWAFRDETGSADFPAPTPERVRLMVERIISDAEVIAGLRKDLEGFRLFDKAGVIADKNALCPFCGSPAAVGCDVEPDPGTDQGIFHVNCKNGHTNGKVYFTRVEAWADWINRPDVENKPENT